MTAASQAVLLPETLTRRFAQNNSEIDGLGCRQVNFASAVFSLEHSLIRQGCTLVKLRRRAVMNELTLNGDFLIDGLGCKPLFQRGNRTAPQTTGIPAIELSDVFTTSRAGRGRKE